MNNQDNKPLEFTEREIQIIQLAAQGYSNIEIAQKLNYSKYTVKSYISSIIKKSDAKNRINAVYILTLKGYVNYSLLNKQK